MDTQSVTSGLKPDPLPKPRRLPVRSSDYDPQSHLVSARYLPLVVGFSTVTAWRKRRAGTFPAPIKISTGRVAWLRSDLEAWLAALASK